MNYVKYLERTMKKNIAIITLAIIGFITTIKLALIYYDANFNPYALSSFCSINEFIDCDGIAQTVESQFFGIPLAYWGMFFYLFIMLMLFAEKLKSIKLFKFFEVFKNPYSYIAALGLFSFIVSITLLCVSLFEIKKLCVLCAFTYILNFLIACIAADFSIKKLGLSIKESIVDFIDAIKIKKYLIAFILCSIVACGFLAYTSTSLKFAPQVKNYKEFGEYLNAKKNKYAVSGNILGKEDSKRIVYLYSDYQCPICYAHNIMIHKIVHEMKDILVIHRNLPLDNECNPFLKNAMHEGACVDARYSIAAEKQGKLWDMNDILFEHKPKTESEILELVKNKDFDVDKLKEDANSSETIKELKSQIEEAEKLKIIGTPTVMINNKLYIGIKPYSEYYQNIKDALDE